MVYNNSPYRLCIRKRRRYFYGDVKTGKETPHHANHRTRITALSLPSNDTRVVYGRSQNLFAWDMSDGLTVQLINFQAGAPIAAVAACRLSARRRSGTRCCCCRRTRRSIPRNPKQWQPAGKMAERKTSSGNFDVLRSRRKESDTTEAWAKPGPKKKELRAINIEDKNLSALGISPTVAYQLPPRQNRCRQKHHCAQLCYESGFTEDIPGRTKVGAPRAHRSFFVFDAEKDTVLAIKPIHFACRGSPICRLTWPTTLK